MSNWLVLIHSKITGDVVRQIVVVAEDAAQAITKVQDSVGPDEHAIVIPTGSVPDPTETPESVPAQPATDSEPPETPETTPSSPETEVPELAAEDEDVKSLLRKLLEKL
jgi:hypothetical protein